MEKKQAEKKPLVTHRLTLGGDYLVDTTAMDRFLGAVDLVVAHFDAGSALDRDDGAAIELVQERDAFRRRVGL